jgi:DNA-directed RNA polymerase subunit RPC12/RpoP
MNLIDVTKKFATPEACNDFIESMRWPEGVTCLACESKRVTKYTKQAGTRPVKDPETGKQKRNPETGKLMTRAVPARILYVCLDCGKQFSATEGTIFSDTHLDLEKWFMAVALMVNAKKGVSALQMKRDLKVAYKTAWYLNHRIRKAMALIEQADDKQLSGTVEVDETYIGGKYDKRRNRQKWDKEPVFGMVERGGKAKTYHVPHINRYHVIDEMKDNIAIDTDLVCTDESAMYKRMPDNVKKHEIVNHSAKEWVRGDVHTGTIDGYWGLLKRGVRF